MKTTKTTSTEGGLDTMEWAVISIGAVATTMERMQALVGEDDGEAKYRVWHERHICTQDGLAWNCIQ